MFLVQYKLFVIHYRVGVFFVMYLMPKLRVGAQLRIMLLIWTFFLAASVESIAALQREQVRRLRDSWLGYGAKVPHTELERAPHRIGREAVGWRERSVGAGTRKVWCPFTSLFVV